MNTKKIVYSSVFIALGVITPQIFHLLGGPALGAIFLPMHFPVLAAGLLCGPMVGCIAGILSPILSSAITGMPPVPRLWFMILELGIYGVISGWIYHYKKKNVLFSLITAMIAGRLVYGIFFTIMIQLFGLNLPVGLGAGASLVKGIPGIILQVIILPILILFLERSTFNNEGINKDKGSTS